MTPIYKISSRGLFLALVGIMFALSGCAQRIGDLTLISTKNIDLNASSLDVKEGKRFQGSDCVFALFGMIPFGMPNLKNAVDDALQQGGGNMMVDEVTYVSGYYFVLGSVSCIKAEGTVLNGVPKKADAQTPMMKLSEK